MKQQHTTDLGKVIVSNAKICIMTSVFIWSCPTLQILMCLHFLNTAVALEMHLGKSHRHEWGGQADPMSLKVCCRV